MTHNEQKNSNGILRRYLLGGGYKARYLADRYLNTKEILPLNTCMTHIRGWQTETRPTRLAQQREDKRLHLTTFIYINVRHSQLCLSKNGDLWCISRCTFVYSSPSVWSTHFQLPWGRRKKASLKLRNSITVCTASYARRLEWCEFVYLCVRTQSVSVRQNTKCMCVVHNNITTNSIFYPHGILGRYL